MRDKHPRKNDYVDRVETVGFIKNIYFKKQLVKFVLSHKNELMSLDIFTGVKRLGKFGDVLREKVLDLIAEEGGIFKASGKWYNSQTLIADKVEFSEKVEEFISFANKSLPRMHKGQCQS